jgi:hypothetical protein
LPILSPMAGNAISPEVQQFVARYIRSVEQLVILLVLHGARERLWTAQEVFRQIQSSEKSVTDGLEFFMREGLVQQDAGGKFQLKPDAAEGDAVPELARAYRERRVAIIELIYTKPAGGVQSFADAFRFKKKE